MMNQTCDHAEGLGRSSTSFSLPDAWPVLHGFALDLASLCSETTKNITSKIARLGTG